MKVFSGKKRTSYSHGRKRAAGNISDSVVPFQYLVFRLGWVVKNMHTIYDYVHDSEFKDISAAKKLADWPEFLLHFEVLILSKRKQDYYSGLCTRNIQTLNLKSRMFYLELF